MSLRTSFSGRLTGVRLRQEVIMENLKLSGCGTALVTPFRNGEVDYEVYAGLVDRQVAAGIHFLVPLGTTGETPCLDVREKLKILEITKDHCKGKPVIVGGGTNSLAQTLKGISELETYGPDAYLIVVPYYNKPTQEGMYEYFKAVAGATDKGIVLYNVPGRTGANLKAETTLRLAEIPNIIAIKEASGNYSQISEIIRNAPEGFSVLSGNDEETLPLMATGADGIISVASNIDPEDMIRMTEALLQDDIVTARRLHLKLMPLFRNCFVESNPIPVKAGMTALGLMENEFRLPLCPASQSTCELMEKTVKELELK